MQLWHRRRKEGTVLTQALKGRKLLLVGFTLFSMFFGAGNLIFPPDLGAKAGVNLWPASVSYTHLTLPTKLEV